MAEAGRDLSGELFGTAPVAGGWTKDQIIARIRSEAERQNVDPDLAVAVATQESSLNPHATGDGGKSLGLFQLQEGAAKDAGINPRFRHEPDVNMYAGVRYLKQKLQQSGGNVEQALSRYNRGTPDYRGIGDPDYVQNVMKHYPGQAQKPTQQPGILARVSSALSPASAEAATPSAAGRDLSEELFGTAPVATPPRSPQIAPGSTQPTQRDIAVAPQTPHTSWTPGMRFQALPSITQLEPSDRMQKTTLFEALDPQSQEEFLRSEEPASDLVVDIEKPSTPQAGAVRAPRTEAERQTRVRAELAAWEQQAGRQWREGDPRMPSEKRLGVPDQPPVTESITAPSTMIPLLMPGAGLKLAAGPIKALPSLLQRGARPVAEGLSQTAGWTAGRTAETGDVPSPAEIGKEAALNVATGGLVEIPGALRDAKNAVLRSTPGAQILLNQRAVQEAEGLGKRVFNAQEKAVVSKAFDSVAATGEKLDVTPVRDLWNSLTVAERRIAGNELSKISSTFADALKTRKLGDWDIGELQHLRSELRTASLSKRTPETQDLLGSLRGSMDEAIHHGMAKGSLPAAELVEAQKAYRKVMQAEDLQGLVTKHTKDSPNLKWQELNLAALNKDIRGGGTRRAREFVKGMDATEKQLLTQELDSLKRHYPFVSIPRQGATMAGTSAALAATGLALTGNLPAAAAVAVPAILAAASRSPNVMSLFKRSIIEGKGRLAQHHVDALMNAIRHENEGETPAQQP